MKKSKTNVVLSLAIGCVFALASAFVLVACGSNDDDNENLTFDSTKFAVTNSTATYDGQKHMINVAYQGVTINTQFSVNDGAYTSTSNAGVTNAGTYSIKFKVTAEGYDEYTSSAQTLTINKANITVTVADGWANKRTTTEKAGYGSTVSGATVQGADYNITYSEVGLNLATADYGDEYAITATVGNPNFNATIVNGTGTVVDNVTLTTDSASDDTMEHYETIHDAIMAARNITGATTAILNANITHAGPSGVNTELTIDGRGKYTITAAAIGEWARDWYCMIQSQNSGDLTFKDVTVDANDVTGALAAIGTSSLTLDNASVKGGYLVYDETDTSKNSQDETRSTTDLQGAGVYVTDTATFKMINNSKIEDNTHEYVQGDLPAWSEYSQGLWIGAGAKATIESGSSIDYAYVNCNSASNSDRGILILDGGKLENLFISYHLDSQVGATFNFISGTLENFYLSDAAGDPVSTTATTGNTYTGGTAVSE